MTPREWLDILAAEPLAVGLYLLALPILAFGLGFAHERGHGNDSPWQ